MHSREHQGARMVLVYPKVGNSVYSALICSDKLLTSRNCGVGLGVGLRSLPALTVLGVCDSHQKEQTTSILRTSPRAW